MPVAASRNPYTPDSETEASATVRPDSAGYNSSPRAPLSSSRNYSSRRATGTRRRNSAIRPSASPSIADNAAAVRPARPHLQEPDSSRSAGQASSTQDIRLQQARRRARRAHRPVHVTFGSVVLGAALLVQLVWLLWVKGLALSAMHRSEKLGDASHGEIGRVNEDIAQTQRKIATLSSPTQLKKWADQRGWTMATPDKFDDVTKLTPLNTNNEASADTASEAGNTAQRRKNKMTSETSTQREGQDTE